MVHLEIFKFFSMDEHVKAVGQRKRKSWRDKEDQIALSHSMEPQTLLCSEEEYLTVDSFNQGI